MVVIVACVPLALLVVHVGRCRDCCSAPRLPPPLRGWARRLIGGYTGDVLGAIEQVFEIGFLLGVAAIRVRPR